ncbi:MAG: CPBP family intramembrane glutamic endopeptidase [Pseudomonadota bacterium]
MISVNDVSKKPFLIVELVSLFVAVPFLLTVTVPIVFKVVLVLAVLFYCVMESKKMGILTRPVLLGIPKASLSFAANKNMMIRILSFIVISTIAMAILYPERLFYVILNKPLLWLGICIFYAVFSVYPQEFLYRTYFFARYRHLVTDIRWFVLLNAIIFSFAHVIFDNALVYILTFAGGLLFAYTYSKTRCLMLVSIEHSIYGLWLYTLGIGHMLAFPG